MSSLLSRQYEELSEFLDTGHVLPKFNIRKLPMWGIQVEDTEINFEWPTLRDLDMISPDVSLSAIQFKTC